MFNWVLSLTLFTIFVFNASANMNLDGRWAVDGAARCADSGKIMIDYSNNNESNMVRIENGHMFYGYLKQDRTPVRMNFNISNIDSEGRFRADFIEGDTEKSIYFGEFSQGKLHIIFEELGREDCREGLISLTFGKI